MYISFLVDAGLWLSLRECDMYICQTCESMFARGRFMSTTAASPA
jgi:hypothetical protein